jgi:hypothetical protein
VEAGMRGTMSQLIRMNFELSSLAQEPLAADTELRLPLIYKAGRYEPSI